MSQATTISWTDATWNPVRGCSRMSAGCQNCYAMGQAHRFSGPGKPFDGLTTIRRGKVDWSGRARFVPDMLEAPLRWKKPRRIFVNSMSDLFHESLSNEEIAAVFGVMAACPQHTFQVLTKRPEVARAWFDWVKQSSGVGIIGGPKETITVKHHAEVAMGRDCADLGLDVRRDKSDPCCFEGMPWPLPNVWLGVSVEDQKTADSRIPNLLATPASVRFVSAEPLLDAVDVRPFTTWLAGVLAGDSYATIADRQNTNPARVGEAIRGMLAVLSSENCLAAPDDPLLKSCRPLDWVIVGGESGPGARPFDIAWARSVVEQCVDAGVPVFVKQLGAKAIDSALRDVNGYGYVHYTGKPDDQRVLEGEKRHDYRVTPHDVNRLLVLDKRKGGEMSEWPSELRVRQFPKVRS